MRLFALAFLVVALAACGSDTATPDVSSTDNATSTSESSDASAIVGFWNEAGRKSSLDADLRVSDGTVTWTFREDGTAQQVQQFEALGPDPLTEDLSWTLDGSTINLTNTATGDDRHSFEIVEQSGTSMTLHNEARSEYMVLERGE
ncbi:MAG: hypothetical protein Rubg2KO_00110 [Rubricoccaceae bacterium]